MPEPVLTAEERVKISRHLGWEYTEPISFYVQYYVHAAYDKVAENPAALADVRTLLAQADAAWEKYNASLTKQELDQAGSISFNKRGEIRLMRTHRTIAVRLARALNIRTNFAPSNGAGGLKFQ